MKTSLAYRFKMLSVVPQEVYTSHPNVQMLSLGMENLEESDKNNSDEVFNELVPMNRHITEFQTCIGSCTQM